MQKLQIFVEGQSLDLFDFETIQLKRVIKDIQDPSKLFTDYSRSFETKAPDYFRVDIGASFRKNNPTWSWIVSLDLQNATGRLNVWDEYYSNETKQMEQIYMVGLIPVLNYRVEF